MGKNSLNGDMSELNDFKAKVLELNESLNKTNLNFQIINVYLDDLNAFDCCATSIVEDQHLERLLVHCCTSIPTNNSLLVAKSCNLLLNLLNKCRMVFSNGSLTSILKWINDAAHQSSDIAFIDIFQVLNSIIKVHSTFFSEYGGTVVPFLFEKLELVTNVMLPNDIKLWRALCLQSLAKNMFKEDRTHVINQLLDMACSQSTDDLFFHAKIWRLVIETLDCLCPKGNTKWLLNKLTEIMGIILAASVLGINTSEPLKPTHVFPSALFHQHSPRPDAVAGFTNKRKSKSKVKRISWNEKSDENLETQGISTLDVYQVEYLTSDSDFSDSEGSQAINLTKEQAKTRHATFNFIIRLTNVLKLKQLYGYYHPLLNTLIHCLRNENVIKLRIGILAAIRALLLHSKPFLAQALHSEGTSFMAFSENLSELITNIHSCIASCLSGSLPTSVLIPLLHTTATLISVSPYHRLKPSLLLSIFCNVQPYLKNKDADICEGGFKCLNEIVCIDPSVPEQANILKGINQVDFSSTSYWILSESTFFLENSSCGENVRIVCWQLLGSLCKHHFHIIQENIESLDKIFFSNLNATSSEEQLHVIMTLNKFLLQIIGKSELEFYNKQLWTKLLGGPLIILLQSPDLIASEACDCLANMGPIVFNSLKEEERILVITLIFGCVNHEKAKVRAAAVHTLGIFLLFPQLSQEQFLFDTRDLLEKSLSDSYLIVRIKAAWSLGNLVDLLVNNDCRELLNEFNIKKILSTCLALVNDDEMVKSNILRALGYILSLLTKEDLSEAPCRNLLEKAVQFFLKCTSSGTKMKMRWNACYAVGTMLRNEELYLYCDKWMGPLLATLSNLIVTCNNFKVRASASTALCQIKSRLHFSIHYSSVFVSLLDGLENAANMTDFGEYKHQDSLKQHLCIAICHLVSLLESGDVAEIERIMNLRMENVSQHFIYFQNNTPPEKAAIMITAANHIQCLMQDANVQSHNFFLNEFKQLFQIIHL